MLLVNSKRIALFFLSLLILICSLFPSILLSVKFVLILLIIIFSLSLLSKEKFNFQSFIFLLIILLVSLWGSLYGVIQNTPGALPVLRVMLIYPILFFIFSLIYDENQNDKFIKLLLISGLSVGVFLSIFNFLGVFLPSNPLYQMIMGQYGDLAVIDEGNGEYFKFTLPTVTSILFYLPFSIGVFIGSGKYQRLSFWAILFLLIPAILSGRRAIFLMTLLGVFLVILINRCFFDKNMKISQKKIGIKSWVVLFLCICFGLYFYGEYLDFYINRLLSIFDFTGDDSNLERVLQFKALYMGIVDSPILGNGAGAASSYLRSDTLPWAYELSYVALIFQYGILGTLIYFLFSFYLILFMFKRISTHGKDNIYYPFLMGLISFLLANATNPYLGKLDYLWILFVPFTFSLRSNKNKVAMR